MGRFYETTATPTVDYSAEFPFTELFQAHKYQQDRSDQAYKDLGLAWDELLKVGYIPGGGDEEYVKNKRTEFENLYRSATEKGNLANNYNWIQRQISLIGRDPSLIDIHRSYLGGNEKIKNDQALKEKGQYKDHLSPNNFGWDTRKSHIFGSKQGDFTTPWLEWKPTALSYFNDVPEEARTGEAGWNHLTDIAARNASDFAASPEGSLAVDEHIREGVLTEGLDPKDPNFRNDVAYKILVNQAEEVWQTPVQENTGNKNNKNNKSTDDAPDITTVANPYYDVLSDIYRPSLDGSENPYTNTENVQMVNGAQLTQQQVDDLLGIKTRDIKDDNGTVTGTKRVINLGQSTYLDVSGMGGGVYYSYNEETGQYAANTDLSQSNSYERQRQAYDIKMLTHFYEQGWVQEILNSSVFGTDENDQNFLTLVKEYTKDGLSKQQAIDKAQFEIAKEKLSQHPQFAASRELLLQNGIDPIMPEYHRLYHAHKNHLNSLDTDGDKIASLMSEFQHNIQSLEGLDIDFRVNDTDDNTFLTYGFNANGDPENRLAVKGYAIVTEDALEKLFDQSANMWRGNDWVDQLVDRAGVIKVENLDGDNSTYRIPLYIPVEMSESRMEEYNNGRISSSEGSDEKIRERKKQFRTMVSFNEMGNYRQMQQRSLTMQGNNNAARLKVAMNDGDVSVLRNDLEFVAGQFENSTLKNQALQEVNDVFAALHLHSPIQLDNEMIALGDYKTELLNKYPTMEAAKDAYKILSVHLGETSWNHQSLTIPEIEENYRTGRLGNTQILDPNTLKAEINGTTYIDATKPGYDIITDVKTYKEVAASELPTDVPVVDISDQSGEDAVITNTNYSVKSTAYSPYLTATSARYFNALLGDIGTNLTISGAHRTQAYNTALMVKGGHKSPGRHISCQALDLSPNKAALAFLNKHDKQTLETKYGIRNFLEEGKGTSNHHIHIEFIR
jgi:hypothetical protein